MPYGSVGGMEKLAFTFYKHFKSLGYNVTAIKIIKLPDDLVNFGADEISFSSKDFSAFSKLGRLKFYMSIPQKLKKVINKKKIDYTISFGDMANCFNSLSNTSETKIATIHAHKSIELTSKSLMNSLFKLSYSTIYKRFRKVVCISEEIKKDLQLNLKYKFKNLEVIYNPHDYNFIERQAAEVIEDNFENKVFEQDTILFLGRLSVQKAPWHLLNAFHLSQQKSLNLVFIGDGTSAVLNTLLKLTRDLGMEDRVFFFGRKKNPYKYLRRANVIALTSYYEGTPNVIAEAIALGIPVISSDCTAGIAEMMSLTQTEPDGSNLITEAGIITPTFFEGKLEIPTDFSYKKSEEDFAAAIDFFFENQTYLRGNLQKNKAALWRKYEVATVCENYLS